MSQRDPDFDEFFRRCFPAAVSMAGKMLCDASAGEELAAEALARACLHWKHVRSLENPDAWVMRTTKNLVVDAARRRRLVARHAQPARPEGPGLPVEDVLALRAALRKLPGRQLEAVLLCRYGEITAADAAPLMGVSENTVATHMQRGLKTLQKLLGDTQEVAPCSTT